MHIEYVWQTRNAILIEIAFHPRLRSGRSSFHPAGKKVVEIGLIHIAVEISISVNGRRCKRFESVNQVVVLADDIDVAVRVLAETMVDAFGRRRSANNLPQLGGVAVYID